MNKVLTTIVGRKSVGVTAYCPTDVYGQLAEDMVLEKIASVLGNISEDEFRAWLTAKNADLAAEIFAILDSGGTLPKSPPWSVRANTAAADARIVSTMRAEHDHN